MKVSGHLWRDKWTGLSGPLSETGLVCRRGGTLFTEMCSGSEAGVYLRLIVVVYHATLGLIVIKKKKKDASPRHGKEPRLATWRAQTDWERGRKLMSPNCEDRVLDGPASGEKGSKGRNPEGILSVKQHRLEARAARPQTNILGEG